MKKKQTTRATAFLERQKVSFEIIQYDHLEKGAVFASQATGFPLERTVKTLVVDLGNKEFALALMPGDRELSLKRLALNLSVKRASMADPATAERLTGYHVGGISPFGTRRPFTVVMEQGLLAYETVVINAGQRGVMIKIAPGDILTVLGGKSAELAE